MQEVRAIINYDSPITVTVADYGMTIEQEEQAVNLGVDEFRDIITLTKALDWELN